MGSDGFLLGYASQDLLGLFQEVDPLNQPIDLSMLHPNLFTPVDDYYRVYYVPDFNQNIIEALHNINTFIDML